MSNNVTQCYACGAQDLEPIFKARGIGFTLAQRENDIETTSAYLCRTCSHVQTPPFENIESYYDTDYVFQMHDAEEDDIYAVEAGGRRIFRAEHQARSVAQKFNLHESMRVLDYGCGKARTLQLILDDHPSIAPFVFDVSDVYGDLWDRFVPKANQAAYRVPEAWFGTMDLVLSFFALEHTADPQAFVRDLAKLVRPGGSVHVVIPNMYRNISDLVVVDHVQHFSGNSLVRLFADAGYSAIRIDTETHRAAFIVNAIFDPDVAPEVVPPAQEVLAATMEQARSTSRQWEDIADRIEAFEKAHPHDKSVIYGSGVYGMFIAASLRDRSRVAAFLDMNPFRQGRELMGIPIISPDKVPNDATAVYVGLNPQDARGIISGVSALHSRAREMFFL